MRESARSRVSSAKIDATAELTAKLGSIIVANCMESYTEWYRG